MLKQRISWELSNHSRRKKEEDEEVGNLFLLTQKFVQVEYNVLLTTKKYYWTKKM